MPITTLPIELPPTSEAFPAVGTDQPVTQCVHGFVWNGPTASVTASITAGAQLFTVASITASNLIIETQGGTGEGPGGKPLPIIRFKTVGPVVSSSNGVTPLTIEAGQWIALNVTLSVPDNTSLIPGDAITGTCVLMLSGSVPGSTWTGTLSGLFNPTVSPPADGLGSNSNYFLYNNCNPIVGLSVTIEITQAIVCESANGPTKGFGFQLNAYSPVNANCAVQQYCVALEGNELCGIVENWRVNDSLFTKFLDFAKLPNFTLPAGYSITMTLQNDSTDNITGITFVVTDEEQKPVANISKSLESIGATASELAPIVAFQLNVVGPINGESAVLSSGAGTIVYQAATPLSVLNYQPGCAAWPGAVTEETANTYYGQLSAAPTTGIGQSFNVGGASGMIRKIGSGTHRLGPRSKDRTKIER